MATFTDDDHDNDNNKTMGPGTYHTEITKGVDQKSKNSGHEQFILNMKDVASGEFLGRTFLTFSPNAQGIAKGACKAFGVVKNADGQYECTAAGMVGMRAYVTFEYDTDPQYLKAKKYVSEKDYLGASSKDDVPF